MICIVPTKDEIRKRNKLSRASMSKDAVKEKSLLAAKLFLSSEIYKNSNEIMLYMPLGNEVDVREIIKAAVKDGKNLIFPVTDPKDDEITPYYADEETSFERGAYSILEPRAAAKADLTAIDIVLVPGVAFDRSGGRIGFGKGCYDRFLKNLTAVKLGVCFDFQISETIDSKPHDVRMDFLLTESLMIRCKNK